MKVFCFGRISFNLTRTFATHHEKNFVPVFFKVSITLSLEKKLCLEKTLEKVMNFAIQKLYEPCSRKSGSRNVARKPCRIGKERVLVLVLASYVFVFPQFFASSLFHCSPTFFARLH